MIHTRIHLLLSYKGGGPIGSRGSFLLAASPLAEGSDVLGPGPVDTAAGLWVARPLGGNPAGTGCSLTGPSAACRSGGNGALA